MTALLLAAALLLPGTAAASGDVDVDATAPLEWELLEAETALAQGEARLAASHYRGAVREAWFLLGLIEVAEGDLAAARDALHRARNAAAVDLERSRIALALVELRLGEEVEKPLRELRYVAEEDPRDAVVLRRFAEALLAAGREGEYRSVLERLRALDPAAAEAVAARASSAGASEVPFPGDGGLGTLDAEGRERLRARLAATLVRAYRNLAALQERTGFQRGVEALRADADEVAASHPGAAEPFGRVDLTGDKTLRQVHPPRLDPVALIAAEPHALHPAVHLVDDGDLEGAEAELRRHLDGEHGAAARSLLGRVLVQQGRDEEAERELRKAIEAGLERPTAHQTLARLIGGRPDDASRAEALALLRRAAELGPLDRDLALVLAGIELAAGRRGSADRQLRSLDKRFGSVEALLLRVGLHRTIGREKQALDAAERATRRAPNSEEVLLTHARLALELDVLTGAGWSVEPLVRMRPGEAEYRFLLGQLWRQRRNMREATEALLEAVELDPGLVSAYLPLGLSLNHESRFEEAKGYLERYLEAHPGNLDALAGLAEAEERLGDPESAERRALAVLERDPAHPRAHLVIGLVRAGRGDFAGAREAFGRAVGADPAMAKAHYQLSLACARLGDRECAAEQLERYKRALEGPEASHVQMQPAEGPTMMQKQETQKQETKGQGMEEQGMKSDGPKDGGGGASP